MSRGLICKIVVFATGLYYISIWLCYRSYIFFEVERSKLNKSDQLTC